MALAKELIIRLNNDEEPLKKRLCIARNTFEANELPIQKKEEIVLNWFCARINSEKRNAFEIVPYLRECLSTEQMLQLKSNDIKSEIKEELLHTLHNKLKNDATTNSSEESFMNCGIILLTNPSMQSYYKMHIEEYMSFAGLLLKQNTDSKSLEVLLNSIGNFSKYVSDRKGFNESFITTLLSSFSEVMIKFDNKQTADQISFIMQKTLYRKINIKMLDQWLSAFFNDACENTGSQQKYDTLKLLFKKLNEMYENSNEASSASIYVLIFKSFCNNWKSHHLCIYKFFVLLLATVGVRTKDFQFNTDIVELQSEFYNEKSLNIISKLLEVLCDIQIDSDTKFNNILFDDYIQNLARKIITLTKKPSVTSFKVLQIVVELKPIVFESKLNKILMYSMFNHKESADLQEEYSRFLICIFDTFSKLNREEKLIAKMLKFLNEVLSLQESKHKKTLEKNVDISLVSLNDVLPVTVRSRFAEFVENLKNGPKIVKLLRTLKYELEYAVDNGLGSQDYDENKNEKSLILLAQIQTSLICCFFESVRIGDPIFSQITVKNFIADMKQFKGIFKKIVEALLTKECNHELMASFLNICYYWAELSVILTQYSPLAENLLSRATLNESSAYNPFYIHDYVSHSDWETIAQRIMSSDDFNCKRLLQKLMIQKIRTMLLFDGNINVKMKQSIIKVFMSNLDETVHSTLVNDNADDILTFLLDPEQLLSLSEAYISYKIKNGEYNCLENADATENRKLVMSVIAASLNKINSSFRIKRRHSENQFTEYLSKSVFAKIKFTSIINENDEKCLKIIKKLVLCFDDDNIKTKNLKIDEEMCISTLKLLLKLPIEDTTKTVKTILFLLFVTIHSDLKMALSDKSEAVFLCEQILLGILKSHNTPDLFLYMDCSNLLKYILECKNFENIFALILESGVRNTSFLSLTNMENTVKTLIKNKNVPEYRKLLKIAINCFYYKTKSLKLTVDSKELIKKYLHKLCKAYISIIDSNDYKIDDAVDIYGTLLHKYLAKDEKDYLSQLLKHLEHFIQVSLNDIEEKENIAEYIKFFTLVIRNKTKLSNYIEENIILRLWHVFKSKLSEKIPFTVEFFEYASDEQFSVIVDDLLIMMNKDDSLMNCLYIWEIIFNSGLNKTKSMKTHEALQTVFAIITDYLQKSDYTAVHQSVLELCSSIIQSKNILFDGSIVDNILDTISCIKFKNGDSFLTSEEFSKLFATACSVMESLIIVRNVLIVNRLSSYLLRYRHMLHLLAHYSSTDRLIDQYNIHLIADSAHCFEKLTSKMIKNKKDFTRSAPYLISDIIQYYEKITFSPAIKSHLNNCIYIFLDICDDHATSFLLRNLSSASSTMFRLIYEDYKKYHRFVGKV